MYSSSHEGFNEFPFYLRGITFASSRAHVLEVLGAPYRSDEPSSSQFLGLCGGWDKFHDGPDIWHFHYSDDSDSIVLVTLFGPEVEESLGSPSGSRIDVGNPR